MSEMINPYIAGAPVAEKTMFFGRQDVFDWVRRSLTGKFVDHILVIHGQRRVGKTSVLKQIPYHLPHTYIPVFFDLQGRTHTTIDRFLWRLTKEITRNLRTSEDISLPDFTRDQFSEDPELFQNQLLPQLSQAIGDRRLLLIFDEFDSLEEPTAKEMLTENLIPYLSRLMHAPGPLAFIFCIGSSGRKLEHMQASYTDFFRIALYRKISFLEKEEATRLITQPVAGTIEYSRQAIEEIFRITSGHPYFTQLLCHELFGLCQKSDQRHVAPQDVEAVLDDVVERGTVNLKFVWDDASDPERYVLTALSLAEDGRDPSTIHAFLKDKKVRISQREVGDSLRHLQEKDVLAPDNTFTVDLMRLWLLENKPLERVIEELIEVSPIATRYIEIAEEFRESGDREEALDSYRRALRVDRQNLTAQVGVASLVYEQGDLPQAAEEYQKALAIDPEDIGARSGFCQTHMALGDQLRAEGQLDEALGHYQQVLTINEQHLEARERLAAHQAEQGDQLRSEERFDEAIEAFQAALEFTPDDPAISERLAEARAAQRAKGLATLRDAGEEHFQAERWKETIASFEEYLSLDPEDKDAAQAVEARLAEAREQSELAGIYDQAETALEEKQYAEAVSLLREIINRNVGYKDATRLLTQAVELQREARPLWKNIRVLGAAGAGIVLVIIAALLLRFLPGFSEQQTAPTSAPASTATPAPIPVATEAPRPITPTLMAPITTLADHNAPVRSVAFSPDGQTLASGSWDSTVVLWDVETRQSLRRFAGTGMVHSLALSPDGWILATGSMESMVKLWNVAYAEEADRTLEGSTDNVSSVAFSPDGELLATSGWAEGVVLWRVSDGTLLRSMEGHEDDEPTVAFSPDGQTLAAGDWQGRVLLWDVESGELLHAMGWHTQTVWSVAFSPDGQTLASGSADGTVILWDVESGERLHTLRPRGGEVWSVAFSPDGRILAAGLEDSTIALWDAETGEEVGSVQGHTSGVRSVSFSPDGRILASGSEDTTVKLWDMEDLTAATAPTHPVVEGGTPTPTPLPPTPTSTPLTLRGHTGKILGLTFSRDRTMLASGSADGTVRVWRVADGALLHTLEGHIPDVYSPAFSPDGLTLASQGTDEPGVTLWDVQSGQRLGRLEERWGGLSVAFSPDGQMVASAWGFGQVSVQRVSDGTLLRTLERHPDLVWSVAFSPDGATLASGCWDGNVRLWRISDGTLLHILEGHTDEVQIVAFSPDGQTLASGSHDDSVMLWDVGSGRRLHTLRGHMGTVYALAFSPDGASVASGAASTVIVWDVQSGKHLRTLEQPQGSVLGVAFAPDGAILAASGWGWDDATIVIWGDGR
jgi:WD40 repeat protein/tetratricopeptide (TPR) repeat protein